MQGERDCMSYEEIAKVGAILFTIVLTFLGANRVYAYVVKKYFTDRDEKIKNLEIWAKKLEDKINELKNCNIGFKKDIQFLKEDVSEIKNNCKEHHRL